MATNTPDINKILKAETACDHRGASMGRSPWLPEEPSPDKVYIQRVRLDNGGYDPGGAYWGTGAPLYCVFTQGIDADPIRLYYRADNHDRMKPRDQVTLKARCEFGFYLMI